MRLLHLCIHSFHKYTVFIKCRSLHWVQTVEQSSGFWSRTNSIQSHHSEKAIRQRCAWGTVDILYMTKFWSWVYVGNFQQILSQRHRKHGDGRVASAEGRKWKLVLHEKEFETQKLVFIEWIFCCRNCILLPLNLFCSVNSHNSVRALVLRFSLHRWNVKA